MKTRSEAICTALLLDAVLEDPPNRYHPVAWMGSAIGAARRHAPRGGPARKLAYGALLVMAGAAAAAGAGRLLEHAFERLPGPLGLLAEAALLKTTFTVRGLADSAGEVEAALAVGDLEEARRLVSWHLVSRDTSTLGEDGVSAAAVESVAENLSDGALAPLLYYSIGGLPAALAYRFVNTADSMLGYRDPEREWLGKAPARIDDLANLLPARIAALLLVAAAAVAGEDAANALGTWRRDSGRTASPNAGHPMSAMAGALGVELEKVGHYRLGVGGRAPSGGDVGRAVRLMRVAVMLGAGLLVTIPAIRRLYEREAEL